MCEIGRIIAYGSGHAIISENFRAKGRLTVSEKIAALERRNRTQNSPVRIALIMGKMHGGGVEAVVMNYYKNIDRTKIQYDFFVDEDSTHVPEQEINALGGRVILVPPYQKAIAYHKALYHLFTSNHYPLVYSHLNTLSVFPLFAAWRAGVPVRAAHSHSTAGRGETKRNIMKYTLRPFARVFPTHLCACSEYAGRWLFGDRAFDSGKVKVWNNAIDTGRFAYSESVRQETRKALGLSEKFIVGHSGRFMKQKNHTFLVDIFAQIHKRRPDSVLLLTGDGPLMDDVKGKVAGLGLSECVVFLGNVNNMERYYQAMDVFILPSLYEGLPVVGVEAQISGLPLLCSNEMTAETKICPNLKFLSLKDSAASWADEALRLSQGHSRQDMTSYARQHGFDIRTEGAKLSEWYCGLLGL